MTFRLYIKYFLIFCTTLAVLSAFFLTIQYVFAADGSGSATVSTSPSTILVNSTGNTITFVYTASESMNSGGISLTVPAGWSAPQGTSGTNGYTTVSTTGVVGSIFNEADDISNWVHNVSNPTACSGGFTIDTSVKHSGTGSLKCTNSGDSNNGLWYYSTTTALNWSSYSTVGFWINSSSAINNGDLKFDYSTNTNLSSPLESLSLGSSISANTWTYVSFNFGSTTRNAIKSYGMHIANLSSMRNATVYIDSFAIGSGSSIVPTIVDRDILVSAITLVSGDKITITYGAGGGSSGSTAPSIPGDNTFTLKSKTVDSGTLTNIAISPIVTVYDTIAPTVSLTSPSNGSTIYGSSVSLGATASDNVAVAGVKFYIDGVLIGAEDIDSAYTGTLDSTTKSDGYHSIVAVARDTSDNYSTSTAATVTIDNTAPVLSPVTISSNNASTTLAKAGDRVTLSFTSNETISTPTVSFTSGGVTASSSPTIINTSGNNWTASYIVSQSNTSGVIGFSITATDSFGNSRVVTSITSGSDVTFDKTAPTLSSVSLSSSNASTTLAKVGDIITLSFTASEGITTPTVTINSGGAPVAGTITITNVSGNNWTVTYTMSSLDTEGTVTYEISNFSDTVGNSGSSVTSGTGSVWSDKTRPTIISMTSTASDTTADSPIPVSLEFSESVFDLTSDDLSATNATVGNVNGSGTSYTFDLSPLSNGLVTVTIGSGTIQDGAGNTNTDSASLSRTFLSDRPTVSLTSNVSSPTNVSPIRITVTFSTDVIGFDENDLIGYITGANPQNFSGSGSTYTFELVPTGDGPVSVQVPAGVATDITGVNQNFASVALSRTYDGTKPSLTEVSAVETPTTDKTPSYTFNTTEGGSITYGGGCTSSTTTASSGDNTITLDELEDGTYNCTITITDSAGNISLVLSLSTFRIDTTAPVISSVSITPSANSATVRWSTNENSSSKVNYGLTNSYGSVTTEDDISPRATSHAMNLSGLVKCTTYHYQVVSRDANGNSGSSSDGTFTTRGCAGNANVVRQSIASIAKDAGGSMELSATNVAITLSVPASYSVDSAQFQIKQIDKTTALDAIGSPQGVTAVSQVFDLRALTAVDTAQSAFDKHLTVTLNYTDSDISGLNEDTLKIYRNDEGVWTQLTNCSVNKTDKKVTCDTDHFSTFAIFGEPVPEPGPTEDDTPPADNTPPLTTETAGGSVPPAFLLTYGNNQNGYGDNNTDENVTSSIYQFKRFLRIGSIGDDVKQLQIFLNSHGFLVARSGKGSPGQESTTFWSGTKRALTDFQEAHPEEILTPQGLVRGTGNFFSYSMKYVNGLLLIGQ